MHRATFHDVNLRETILNKANLQEATLTQVDLQKSLLHKTNLQGAALTAVDLRNAQLPQTNLSRTMLQDIDWNEARLSRVSLRDAQLLDRIVGKPATFQKIDFRGVPWLLVYDLLLQIGLSSSDIQWDRPVGKLPTTE